MTNRLTLGTVLPPLPLTLIHSLNHSVHHYSRLIIELNELLIEPFRLDHPLTHYLPYS